MGAGSGDFVSLRLLCFVRMLGAGIDLELAELCAAETILGDHAPDGVLDEKNRAALAEETRCFDLLATDVTGEAGVNLVVFLGAGKNHLVGIDHDHEIAGVDVWGEDHLVLATQQAGSLDGNLAKDLVLSIDHMPLALDVARLCRKRFHEMERKAPGRGCC